jgi:hypothetical protein
MPSPVIQAFVQLISGGWWGLMFGLFFSGSWPASLVITSAVYGVATACIRLVWPYSPADSISENWEELTWRERRMIMRALSRAEPVSQRTLTTLTIRAAEATPAGRTWGRALGAAALVATVVVAALNGAPPGWVVAGAAFPVASVALGVYVHSGRMRDRARRTADVNRARLAAPKGVPAGVGGVGA